MDVFSMCSTSPAHRSSSKIYQDLCSARLSRRLAPLDRNQLLRRAAAMEDTPAQPHVAVISAGLSGLRYADVLLKRGFQVTVIEARDRIGGRVHQETLANGHLVDIGPNWIHGTSENPIHDLARQTKTAVGLWDKTSHVFDELGALIPAAQGQEYTKVMWDIIQDAFQHSNRSSPDIDKARSLLDFFHQATAEKIAQADPDHERKRRIVLQLSEAWGAFIGSPVSQQSLKFFWLEECIEGGKNPLQMASLCNWNGPGLTSPPWELGVRPFLSCREPLLCRDVQEDARRRGQADDDAGRGDAQHEDIVPSDAARRKGSSPGRGECRRPCWSNLVFRRSRRHMSPWLVEAQPRFLRARTSYTPGPSHRSRRLWLARKGLHKLFRGLLAVPEWRRWHRQGLYSVARPRLRARLESR